MISVPSHLQPLNGNKKDNLYFWNYIYKHMKQLKLFLYCFSLHFIMQSCNPTRQVVQPVSGNYQPHKVLQGENFGKIANTYDVTQEEIKKMNPGVDFNHLKPGQVIKIPIKKTEEKKEEIKKEEEIKERKKTTSRIAIILPLNAAQNSIDNQTDLDIIIDPNTVPYIHFYQGVMLALDSLTQNGNNFSLTVIDTWSDSTKLVKLINDSLFRTNDLVIGVSVGNWLNLLAAASVKYNKQLIIAQSNSAVFLQNHPRLILTAPSVTLQCQLMSSFIHRKFGKEQLILLHQDTKKENDLAAIFSTALEISHLKEGRNDSLKIKNLIYTPKLFESNSKVFDKTKKNVILIPSSDEAFVSPIITRLDSLDDFKFILCGLPTWENFETIDPQRLQNLETHIFSSTFIDYNLNPVKRIRKNFLEKYKSDPVFLGYLGFSLAYLSGSILEREAKDFNEEFERAKTGNLPVQFNLSSKSKEDGMENHSITILKFENYKLIPVE